MCTAQGASAECARPSPRSGSFASTLTDITRWQDIHTHRYIYIYIHVPKRQWLLDFGVLKCPYHAGQSGPPSESSAHRQIQPLDPNLRSWSLFKAEASCNQGLVVQRRMQSRVGQRSPQRGLHRWHGNRERERERESPIVMASKLESMASNLLANLREIDR